MQARSGRAEPLFKPVKGRKTRGGFGRNGIACREFRHLRRACPNVLSLVGLPEEEAGELLREALEDLRSPKALSPAEAEGLLGWCDDWRHDFSANAKACTILVDAMARFTMQLKAQGTSPRTMSGVYGDLNAAGFLVMCYDAPKGEKVLDSFRCDPSGYEYSRQISDSPRAMQRFASTWRAFAGFLRESQDRREEPGDVTAKTG